MTGLVPAGLALVALAGFAVAAAGPARADGQAGAVALSPFDVADPAIGFLEPALRHAVQQAAEAAGAEGVSLTVTSGWRSPEFQQRLLDDAVVAHGSLEAARRYVQTPQGSRHVTGRAVDIGGIFAEVWLASNGARFGLCRIYANEPWHFELAAGPDGVCPPLLPDASFPEPAA